MIQEILLSLSGHPSPLFAADKSINSILSPSEQSLVSSLGHLSELHCKLIKAANEISSSHPSSICRAVATSISSHHLAEFQQKVLDVEESILRKDASSVAAYNIVPLTHIVNQFSEWQRRMEWLWELVQFMSNSDLNSATGLSACSGARIIDKLCDEAQTGYYDVEDVSQKLRQVAEMTWLRQASAWILYGRLPPLGQDDFFISVIDDNLHEYEIRSDLLPKFVSLSMAGSILFIGKSLNHLRLQEVTASGSRSSPELELLTPHLQLLSSLKFPLTSSGLSQVILAIRKSLSQNSLKKLLPLSRILEILDVLRGFFLLSRGEFAISLISEADEKIRNRWRRADNIGADRRGIASNIAVRDGEVSAVLNKTWVSMSSLQDDEAENDDILELARDLVRLNIVRQPATGTPSKARGGIPRTTSTHEMPPFNSLLLSIPLTLSLDIPSPLDLFLVPADMQIYSDIHAYLLSIRRAHLRLTGLWKISQLRRDHPPPPRAPYGNTANGKAIALTMRTRAKERARSIRDVWATSSAAVFILGETEAYLHGEVIGASWEGFQQWLTDTTTPSNNFSSKVAQVDTQNISQQSHSQPKSSDQRNRDPQTLSDAHYKYLNSLANNLLINIPAFTEPLYRFLNQVDHLVALVQRIQTVWQSLDLESDSGVIDAFSDFHKEEVDIKNQLGDVAAVVKEGIKDIITGLREVDQDKELYDVEQEIVTDSEDTYIPKKIGRVDRLLMKLDFGGWFDATGAPNTVDTEYVNTV